jgi:hypothetical protein
MIWGETQMKLKSYVFAAIAGALFGYFACFVYANSEDVMYYSLRSYITGETALSKIVDHPADRWIGFIVLNLFLLCGASLGVLVRMIFRVKATNPS